MVSVSSPISSSPPEDRPVSDPAETIRTPVEAEPELHPPVPRYGDEPIASIPATDSYDGVPRHDSQGRG